MAHGETLPDIAGAANAPRDLYLNVKVNGESTSVLAHFRQVGDKLSTTGEELERVGFLLANIGATPQSEIALDAISGLRYEYDPGAQTINLDVPDRLRKPQQLNERVPEALPAATTSRGLALNYDVYAQSDAQEPVALYSEARYFDEHGVLSNTGTAYFGGNAGRYVRYDTTWSRSDPTTLDTLHIGDSISSSLDWTRSVRIGGLQWSTNFSLRPDLVTFPVSTLSGSAVVPTAVSLYVNGVQQYAGTVSSGPFTINQMPGITGAGVATVVTRDALGRSVTTSVPLYIDTRLLSAGLKSYSFEAGFVRRNYGIDSFDYDSRPAASASSRYGVTDSLTVEGHAEATTSLYAAGAGALMRLGMAGVVNGSLVASGGRFTGGQYSIGYRYVAPQFSIDAQTTRTVRRYGDLGSVEGAAAPSLTDRMTVTLALGHAQSVSASYIGYKVPASEISRIGSLTYSTTISNGVSLNFSAYRDFGQARTTGVSAGVSVALGSKTSISVNAGSQNGKTNDSIGAARPADYDGGWGWAALASNAQDVRYAQGQLQYLGRYGSATVTAQSTAGKSTEALEVAGAIVVMDGTVEAARRIDDGFTLVSTDGVAGIPVLHENRVIGVTDASGHLLVPDLNAYQKNTVAIDPLGLPADMRIADTNQVIVPKAQSGVLARFPIERYAAASVILTDPAGKPLPAGASVHHTESGRDTVTGYDGLTFVDGLQRENHLTVTGKDFNCVATFVYRRPGNGTLPTIGPVVCKP
ncbi:fimbria/pilus outer membrane usher protein [Trinickia sp. YCB016]